MTESNPLKHEEMDLHKALSLLTGIPADELLAKKWSMSDIEEKTKAFKRVYSAVVDPTKPGRLHSLTMSEIGPPF